MKIKNNRSRKTWLLLLVSLFFGGLTQVAYAASQLDYRLLESFPGFYTKDQVMTDLPGLILALYKFGIWTVGIAGLFMLVVGGFMYMTSAGNTSSAGSAKGIIADALLGIVAAMGAYLIIYVINPDLTVMKINFTAVDTAETSGTGNSTNGTSTGNTNGSTTGACTGTNAACCKPGVSCVACKGTCVNYSNGYPNLCYTGGGTSCKLNSELANKINSINFGGLAEVSEAWPPTMSHASLCHQDGTCADVRCVGKCEGKPVATIKTIYDKLKSAGLSPVFEHTNCAPYTAAGIYCKTYATMTAPSFHVNLR